MNLVPKLAFAQAAAASSVSISDTMLDWEATVRGRLWALVDAIPRIPSEVARAASIASTEINSGRPGKALFLVLCLIVVGYLAEHVVRRLLSEGRKGEPPADSQPPAPLHQRLLSELPPLLVFTFASLGLFLVFGWPPLLKKAVLTFLAAFIVWRIVMTLALVIAASDAVGRAERAFDPKNRTRVSFWNRRVGAFAAILLFGWAFVSLMSELEFSPEVRRTVAYLFGLGLLAVGIEIVWRESADGSVSRRKASLLTFYLVALWLAWIAGMTGVLWVGIYALLLPRVLAATGRLSEACATGIAEGGWGTTLARVLIGRGARALVIAVAVAWLLAVSRFNLSSLTQDSLADRIVSGVFNAVIVLLLADLIWHLSKGYIDHRLMLAERTQSPDSAELARLGRLRTLLPIFRNALAVLILVVAGLSVLAELGVQIGPLIAGAGIFGVAIGFGSQTLVKDILSGVFYMLDDAFRIGEYIQSGSYQGTVESFSLRSVRLRHHRGPIYTVPFGVLGAVQNMSRDWVMEKWTINITYDSDVETARKLIKKIGLELAQDPEFAASTLEPLKMQGVDSFGEFAVVLKLKLMTLPGAQFAIKRKALVMIKKAFEENGIRIAVPTVEVSGNADNSAAIAQEVTRKRRAVKLAPSAASEPNHS
ncbi:mechanosensitive ion channel family protein [Ensifer sp. BR816]|uniref:mechanosensitive ion channel family protein n=1 Tax=Rhizobium sp. (strain BR816) TaxID=1057002 RepID=UPI000370F150|nr:mechanosensitive ion channel family protein [Ensifer sp. BR816]